MQTQLKLRPIHQDVSSLKLKEKRVELGLTQKEVADRAQITVRQYQRFETGERSILSASLFTALAVCEALNLNPTDLILEVKEKA